MAMSVHVSRRVCGNSDFNVGTRVLEKMTTTGFVTMTVEKQPLDGKIGDRVRAL